MRTFRNATRELDSDTFGGDFWVHKPYKPNLRVQASRISKEEWQKYEARIRELHAEGCTSERARQILRNESSFTPSASQYTAQLKVLGLKTYNTKGRLGGPRPFRFPNDWRQEDVSIEERLQDGHTSLFNETLRSIPEGPDVSDSSSTSAVDSAVSPNSTLRTEISSDDELLIDQPSVDHGSLEAGVAADGGAALPGIGPPSPVCPTCSTLDDTYVLEDGGPLLTFLKVVDPGFAYEPSSPVLRLWPEFADSSISVTWSMLSEVRRVASCLHAARLYTDSFDLYYMVFCHLHKTMDTYIRRHLLKAVLDCARSSSTDQQDECAMAVLRLALRDQGRGTGDQVSAGVLHLYLGELYKKQKNDKAEDSAMMAVQYLAEACGGGGAHDPYFRPVPARTVLQLEFPRPRHTSLLLHNKTIPPAYERYFAFDAGSPAFQLAHDIKSGMVSKQLLKWCAEVIASKSRYLNHLASILIGDTPTMRACIARLLFCCCFEMWLKDSKRTNSSGRYFCGTESALKALKMPWRESLSAISFIIVDEAFRDSDPLAAIKKRFTTKTLVSQLLRTIKTMLSNISETEDKFIDTFLAIVVASGDDRRPSQEDELSRKVLEVFVGNIISSGILREQRGSDSRTTNWKELTPAAVDIQAYFTRSPSLSHTLYTPRSSFSSGARSLRALHAEREQISVRSLSSSQSKGSSTPAWPQSRRSSWSFELVTGLKLEPSAPAREGSMSEGLRSSAPPLEDTVMVDV